MLVKGSTYSGTVTAKDSTSANVSAGGDTFVIRIYNECTDDADFGCVENSGAVQVVPSTIFDKMTDNGDGTYAYSFVAAESGSVVIKIMHATEGIDSKFYDNEVFSDPPESHNVTSNIYYDWGAGGPGSVTDYFSILLDFYFVPEESTDYTFRS